MNFNCVVSMARIMAFTAHKGQVDGLKNDYFTHLERVANSLDSHEEKIVAYLHDILEDTDISIEDLEKFFDKEITEAVELLTRTNQENNDEYITYILRVEENALAKKVKISDLKDNLYRDRPKYLENVDKRYIMALKLLGEEIEYESIGNVIP